MRSAYFRDKSGSHATLCVMKWVYLSILLAGWVAPAAAWEAGHDGPVCTLSHSEDHIDILLTYDPSGPIYTITLRGADPWPEHGVFEMHFAGDAPLNISTTRQVLSDDGLAVTVTDRGFSNVLDGLQFNQNVTVYLGAASLNVQLDGAESAVARFRSCSIRPVA